MEIHFECPVCHRPMKGEHDIIGKQITCPDCQESFSPAPNNPDQADVAAAALKNKRQIEQAAYYAKVSVNRIRSMAEIFVVIGFGLMGIGAVIVIAGLANSSQVGIMAGGAAVGVGLWLLLIGQVIHIRANTHK